MFARDESVIHARMPFQAMNPAAVASFVLSEHQASHGDLEDRATRKDFGYPEWRRAVDIGYADCQADAQECKKKDRRAATHDRPASPFPNSEPKREADQSLPLTGNRSAQAFHRRRPGIKTTGRATARNHRAGNRKALRSPEDHMPSGSITTSERGRELAVARHAASSPEQRRAGTESARAARVQVKDVDAKIDLLGTVLLDRLDALQAQIAKLEGERLAA